MADSKPRITVETGPSDRPDSASQAPKDSRKRKTGAKDVHKVIVSWIETRFPGHGNAIFFGLVGLVAAILIFALGFWRTLLIAVLVVAGVAFGQYLDGDPRIVNVFRKLIGPSDNN